MNDQEQNCTVYLPNETVRAGIVRAIDPEVLSHIVVKFPAEAIKHCIDPDNVQSDSNGCFLAEIPTDRITPDTNVESIDWYYYIGDVRDACPCSIDNWGWHVDDRQKETQHHE